MVNLLVCCTGSVATIKLPVILELFKLHRNELDVNIKVCLTEKSRHFSPNELGVQSFTDSDEWDCWNGRGDPVLHIDLTKWADVLLIAPLDANTLGKIASGICDNMVTCVVRAWEISKPLFFCPAMNTKMWNHPITGTQISLLKSWGYYEIPCISKTLMCGDVGLGAMAEPQQIVDTVLNFIRLNN
ncbi:phosphopantothenoylcysteine decarboxylase [Cimex lectularius]|uniref:Flavoprotein domain-containing protein n=1 Tax=Cimex lectularius TaxID=79782 RepID=A0A8I6SFK6_CIMLE|nr:phosphopantothenoylcysteine decarboxylase [Cimex lectularius]